MKEMIPDQGRSNLIGKRERKEDLFFCYYTDKMLRNKNKKTLATFLLAN